MNYGLIICFVIIFGNIFTCVADESGSSDPFHLDLSVHPGDNFFRYVNDAWISEHPIPSNKSYYNVFSEVNDKTNDQIHLLLDAETVNNTSGNISLIGEFYLSGMDNTTRDNQGLSPLSNELNQIDEIKTEQDVLNSSVHLLTIGVKPLFNYYADQDPTNASRMIPHLEQGGLGLPDRDYYFRNDSKSLDIQRSYLEHIKNIFLLMNQTQNEAEKNADTVYNLEKEIAGSHISNVENRDPVNTTHILDIRKLEEKYPDFGWNTLRTISGSGSGDQVNVHHPLFVLQLDNMLRTVPVPDWKIFLKYKLVDKFSPFLSAPFEAENFEFYSHRLNGVETMEPRWKRVLATVNTLLADEVGRKYVERYFNASSRLRAQNITHSIRQTLGERLMNLSWMEDSTKYAAKQKLDAMVEKIGYPDVWMDYSGLILTDSYMENVIHGSEYLFIHGPNGLDKIGRPVDRNTWFMSPQTINAYYAQSMNDIVFPAAILQPPFFDPTVDDSINYGGIGTVIGHEMTHGFDDQGKQYDKDGNLKNWWTDSDSIRFKNQSDLIVSQYNQFEVLPGLFINGNLTLGENIADFGGLTLAYHAWKRSQANGNTTILSGNLTGDEQLFLSFAQIWRGVARDEFIRTLTYSNPHPWNEFRANGAPFNIPEFYEAFPDISPNDTLYRAPGKRPVIW